jgi:hypothetical protein
VYKYHLDRNDEHNLLSVLFDIIVLRFVDLKQSMELRRTLQLHGVGGAERNEL